MAWDPRQYLRFGDERQRPGIELLARIPDVDAGTIFDLGCGPGNLTGLIADRWPGAEVVGVDSSPEMLDRARRHRPDLGWIEADIAAWRPDGPVDIVYSNAALHWLTDHAELFPRLLSFLRAGGVLAVQMPDNWHEPTHTVPSAMLDSGVWPAAAVGALTRDRVARPARYREMLRPGSRSIDMWETVYHQVLEPAPGSHPVLEWVKGSFLRPVLEALDGPARAAFEQACATGYASAYPPEPDGTVVLPFRRLFMVVTRALGD